jgi:hypothetical protein
MRKALIATVLALAAVATTAAATAAAATTAAATAAKASPLPVVFMNGMGAPWSGPTVRPADITFGSGWYVDRLRWSTWTGSGAAGSGRFVLCSSVTACTAYEGAVRLAGVGQHRGRGYFERLSVTAPHHKTAAISYSGGFWHWA